MYVNHAMQFVAISWAMHTKSGDDSPRHAKLANKHCQDGREKVTKQEESNTQVQFKHHSKTQRHAPSVVAGLEGARQGNGVHKQ